MWFCTCRGGGLKYPDSGMHGKTGVRRFVKLFSVSKAS